MNIIIKNLDGVELLNEEFASFNINDKLYEFVFTKKGLVDLNLDKEKLYNVSFENIGGLGLSTMMMSYISYYFNASTSFQTNELGEQVPVISINTNALTIKKY